MARSHRDPSEPEVTPEMIDVGVSALEYGRGAYHDSMLVSEIYRAMEASRRQAGISSEIDDLAAIERAAWVLWDEVGDGLSDREPVGTFVAITQKMLQAASGASAAVICVDLGVHRPREVQIVCRGDLRELGGTRMSAQIRCA